MTRAEIEAAERERVLAVIARALEAGEGHEHEDARWGFRPERNGLIAVCEFCGAVHEGTASFACAHHRDCAGARLLGAIYRVRKGLDG